MDPSFSGDNIVARSGVLVGLKDTYAVADD